MAEAASNLEVKLAVLETKLDGIQATLNVRLNTIEQRIDGAERDGVHLERNVNQKFEAVQALLDKKADVTALHEVKANSLTKVEFSPYQKALALVGTAAGSALVLALLKLLGIVGGS